MKFVVRWKSDSILQGSNVFLKMIFYVWNQLWINVVWCFSDESSIKNQQNCLIGFADELKFWEVL